MSEINKKLIKAIVILSVLLAIVLTFIFVPQKKIEEALETIGYVIVGTFGMSIMLSPYIYHSFDHKSFDAERLNRNAPLLSCEVKSSSLKGGLKTIVTFSDGFQYWSYDRKNGGAEFGYRGPAVRYYVDREMKVKIIMRAVKSHEKMCDKYEVD